MELDRFKGLIAVQQTIDAARGDLDTVMKAIVNAYSVMPQANGIVVELREGDQLFYAAASGSSAGMLGLRLPLNASLSGMSILTSQPLECDDSETDSRVNRVACRKVGLRSMIVVPIPHRGQTVGVLKYHASEPAAFSEEDMLIAHLMVGPLAVGFASIAEEDARRAEHELQDLVRMKDQFVSTVNHELRTPLTSIAASLGLLAGQIGDNVSPQVNGLIDIANRNAQRLRRLVDDLLDMDRIEAGKLTVNLEQTDLRRLMEDVVAQNTPFAARGGVGLAFEYPHAPLSAYVDPDRLFQAVTNLISNAVKFSPKGSTVYVEADRYRDMARIRVVDEGPGIPPHLSHRLFDRFSQLEHTEGLSNLPGTGLGLAISRGIVEQMNGKIRLVENMEPGATFEILVPLSSPRAAESAA